MNRRRLVLTIFLVSIPCFSFATEPFRLRVLSYNIHHGEGVDKRIDVARIANVIRSVSPDVVALQEVDRRAKRSGNVDQPAELARLTDMNVVFGRNIDLQGGHYGNAVLSKFPIVNHNNVHLKSFENGEQRGVLICELQPKSIDETILFMGTHLDHRRDGQERLASAEQINGIALERLSIAAILAGDLNATRNSQVLKTFAKQWQIANEKTLPTIPVAKPSRQIDFILTRPSSRWKTIGVRVLDESIASDHRAIFAELELIHHEK